MSYATNASTLGCEEHPGTKLCVKKTSTISSLTLLPVVNAPMQIIFASLLKQALFKHLILGLHMLLVLY